MGLVITKAYRQIDLSKFDLTEYSEAWQQLLIEAGLLKPTSTGDDVLIVEMPTYVEAKSAYDVVVTIGWSANNGDFTKESRTMDLETLKSKLGLMVWDRIVLRFFSALVDFPMGFNVWLQRYDAVFCVTPA